MPVTPHQSLVKYLPPTLVHFTKDASKSKKKLPPVSDKKSTQTEDILNSILPPREWTDDGQLWVQYVSSTPATRVDVIGLQELLDQRLQQRQARETGICPIREELYAQCFGEFEHASSTPQTSSRSLYSESVVLRCVCFLCR